ncbi:amino acid ABC transporter ATP-binding protein [Microbacterium ulmi]|uniref:ABC-type polar-amino-acid transporter n=1 Tax=Microbacterium ulmi TaxID=179095 RepID=A0A7Y2M0T9_9MICO|nr:amino acid ABC transporter ATP-binding protein [Microbacterium ulmi]NII68936.1 polar amino acid transport system ATP-binding protein [Microbacterium ulmi]NNH03919.1 amino acid ABC transporter ATP-binding protein [Microbacterium ulmi]
MDPQTPLIDVRRVSKWFGARQILFDVDLRVERGQVVVLIGPSGSGKTTLLRCINRLEEPEKGDVRLDGELVGSRIVNGRTRPLSDAQLSRQRGEMGMVFQRFNLFAHKTALANVTEGMVHVAGIPRSDAEDYARQLLSRVGLAEKADSFPGQLSGGQQQRVAIARALGMRPKAILFDEPTSALDPEMVGEVLEVMRQLADSGMTMVIATHEMGFARDVADQIVMMDHGRVVERGHPSAFFSNPQSDRTRQFLAKVR